VPSDGGADESRGLRAIGIHFLVGYIDVWHLQPPAAAAGSLPIGLALTYRIPRTRQSHLNRSLPRNRRLFA
jgi:hypothetical protein